MRSTRGKTVSRSLSAVGSLRLGRSASSSTLAVAAGGGGPGRTTTKLRQSSFEGGEPCLLRNAASQCSVDSQWEPATIPSAAVATIAAAAPDTKRSSSFDAPPLITTARDFMAQAQRALARSAPRAEAAERDSQERSLHLELVRDELEACDNHLRAVGYRLEARSEQLAQLQAAAVGRDAVRRSSMDKTMVKTMRDCYESSPKRWVNAKKVDEEAFQGQSWQSMMSSFEARMPKA